jgi:hypothetical protein
MSSLIVISLHRYGQLQMTSVHPEKNKNSLRQMMLGTVQSYKNKKNLPAVLYFFIYICTYLYGKFGLRKMTEPRPLYKCTIKPRL